MAIDDKRPDESQNGATGEPLGTGGVRLAVVDLRSALPAAVVGVVLFQTGVPALVGLVPIAVVMLRRDYQTALVSMAVFWVGTYLAKLVSLALLARRIADSFDVGAMDASPWAQVDWRLFLLDGLLPLALLVFLAIVCLDARVAAMVAGRMGFGGMTAEQRLPVPFEGIRFLVGGVLAGLVAAPLVVFMARSAMIQELMASWVDVVEATVNQTGESALGAVVSRGELEMLFGVVTDGMFKGYVVGIALFVMLNRAVARWWVERSGYNRPYTDFVLPDQTIWLLIGSLAAAALSVVVDLGFVEYIAWNAAALVVFAYGCQGVAILKSLSRRLSWTRGKRLVVLLALVVGLLVPGLNIVVLIGVPALGVSELWIPYGRTGKEIEPK